MRYLAGLLLLGHAFVHLAIWLPPYDPERHAFDAKRSQLLINAQVDERGSRRTAAVAAIVVAAFFILGGFATIRGSGWANDITAGAAVMSMLLAALYFHPWLSVLLVVDLAILVVVF
jgi:hypothetical protein